MRGIDPPAGVRLRGVIRGVCRLSLPRRADDVDTEKPDYQVDGHISQTCRPSGGKSSPAGQPELPAGLERGRTGRQVHAGWAVRPATSTTTCSSVAWRGVAGRGGAWPPEAPDRRQMVAARP